MPSTCPPKSAQHLPRPRRRPLLHMCLNTLHSPEWFQRTRYRTLCAVTNMLERWPTSRLLADSRQYCSGPVCLLDKLPLRFGAARLLQLPPYRLRPIFCSSL